MFYRNTIVTAVIVRRESRRSVISNDQHHRGNRHQDSKGMVSRVLLYICTRVCTPRVWLVGCCCIFVPGYVLTRWVSLKLPDLVPWLPIVCTNISGPTRVYLYTRTWPKQQCLAHPGIPEHARTPPSASLKDGKEKSPESCLSI